MVVVHQEYPVLLWNLNNEVISVIIDNIKYSSLYEGIHKDFKEAFDFLKILTPDTVGGEIKQGNLKGYVGEAYVDTADFINGNPKKMEAHKKAIDIHYIIDGGEDVGVGIIDNLTPSCDYNEEQDYRFYSGNISRVSLKRGDFLIAFPEDAHIPAMESADIKKVKRAVVKIEV